jgi:hypothetical protein
VWRRLGFASETHYARERAGLSVSSLKSKRALATRVALLPEVAAALLNGNLGYEAAYLVARISTARTVKAWVDRARERTVKHLREEVEAAELFIRFGGRRDQPPPVDDTMQEVLELERRAVAGEFFEDLPSQISGGSPTGEQVSDREVRAAQRSAASVTFRWHVSASTYRWWRALERVFTRVSAVICRVPVSFLHFACENFCTIWLPAIRNGHLTDKGVECAYFDVYRRDAFRCTSPVCSRRDVTPHHLRYRSAGGGDELENLTTLCVWCHLRGIHEGRLAALPPASNICWIVGRNATMRVRGRTVTAA